MCGLNLKMLSGKCRNHQARFFHTALPVFERNKLNGIGKQTFGFFRTSVAKTKVGIAVFNEIECFGSTDKNIDHRRVPNLMKFFERHGIIKEKSKNSSDYLPGDIVCWNLGGAITHIGLVVNKKSADGKRYLIVHNIAHTHRPAIKNTIRKTLLGSTTSCIGSSSLHRY